MTDAPREDASDESFDSVLREAALLLEPSELDGLKALRLETGYVLADRFVVERVAGVGGMGLVHRGTDRRTSAAVAIKVMARHGLAHAHRFSQEAAVLAELSHPAIVRYVAHGIAPQGMPFLVMEWLDGEDLAQRIERSPLTASESVSLVRRACQAIAVAHARGVVHRDIKPSNLFLVNKEPASLKVLDFGVARQNDSAARITRSGAVIGTVGYMSPEQAMASRDVDARADVFALGCVLFECLTGRAAFAAPNPVAVLAKVLREEPLQVGELRGQVGAPLEALVARMLAKKPADRPEDAAAVIALLDALGNVEDGTHTIPRAHEGLTGGERRIVSIVLGKPRPRAPEALEALPHEPTEPTFARIEEVASRFGAEPIMLRGGALLVVLAGLGAATDQAAQAATCALFLSRLRPDLCLSVATGRAETTGRVPVGVAIDRAAELLAHAGHLERGVGIDDLTAALLDRRFDVQGRSGQLVLLGHHEESEAARLLLGKPTPFVGRDKELAFLDLTLRECIEDSVARAVLVTGPPGQGKSRLRQEFVERVRKRGTVRTVMARADPVGAGSALMLVRQLVLHVIGLRDGAAPAELGAGVRAHVGRVCLGAEAVRIADFLGELIGAPPSESASPQFRAARQDPQIMAAWLRRSFGEWIAAECATCPTLLVLEDLHWGDIPSATYVDEALRASSTKPLMVLALARPEVDETHPNLWNGSDKLTVSLGRLTPRAADLLVRGALGEEIDPGSVSRIVEHADGNAFYLEEIIRRVAEGGGDTLPETVLALLESRLERLDPASRRVVRAASVFGEVFWRGGLAALLGKDAADAELETGLRGLVERELFVGAREGRFAGENEYQFRHGLLREAAYGTLTDTDRATGHKLAGDWLERAGEKDALTLADHFEQGGESTRAVPWILQAAETARDGGNASIAAQVGRRGIQCGAEGIPLGRLHLVVTQAHGLGGDWPGCIDHARQAMALLPAGTTPWFEAAGAALLTGTLLGDPGILAEAIREVLGAPTPTERSGAYGFSAFCVTVGLMFASMGDAARSFLASAEAVKEGPRDDDAVFDMWTHIARGVLQISTADLGNAIANLSQARCLADRTGAASGWIVASMFLVCALSQTGSIDRTSLTGRELVSFCEAIGRRFETDWITVFTTWTRVGAGRAAPEDVEKLRSLLNRPDNLIVTSARAILCEALLAGGDVEQASREAALAAAGALLPWSQGNALRCRVLVELRMGRLESALALADQALETASGGSLPTTISMLRLARAEALHAVGRQDEAREAVRDARDRVRRIASTLDDAELRSSYVTTILANARTLDLAEAWLGEKAS
jgi:eukaryotic-like serine/threonine-protein kinase